MSQTENKCECCSARFIKFSLCQPLSKTDQFAAVRIDEFWDGTEPNKDCGCIVIVNACEGKNGFEADADATGYAVLDEQCKLDELGFDSSENESCISGQECCYRVISFVPEDADLNGQSTSSSSTTTIQPPAQSNCTGMCVWEVDTGGAWRLLSESSCESATTTTPSNGSTSSTSTANPEPSCCDSVTIGESTSTTPLPGTCQCLPPTECGAPGEITVTSCSSIGDPPPGPDCPPTPTSSTSSTTLPPDCTTTTTLGPECKDGCEWVRIFNGGFVKISDECAGSCPCSYPTDGEYGECEEIHTACVPTTTTNPPPPPKCTGSCEWYAVFGSWYLTHSDCFNGAGFCGCEPPSFSPDPDACAPGPSSPCLTPDSSTSTTSDPCKPTSSTTEDPCEGSCRYRSNGENWLLVRDCPSDCPCGQPANRPTHPNQVTFVSCGTAPTTTTSTTTSTTTKAPPTSTTTSSSTTTSTSEPTSTTTTSGPTGACCSQTDGPCVENVTEYDCLLSGANDWYEGWSCDQACPPPRLGACCVDDGFGGCTNFILEPDCLAVGGTWTENQLCHNVCPPLGVCCDGTDCLETTEVDCPTTWLPGQTCDDTPLPCGTIIG